MNPVIKQAFVTNLFGALGAALDAFGEAVTNEDLTQAIYWDKCCALFEEIVLTAQELPTR